MTDRSSIFHSKNYWESCFDSALPPFRCAVNVFWTLWPHQGTEAALIKTLACVQLDSVCKTDTKSFVAAWSLMHWTIKYRLEQWGWLSGPVLSCFTSYLEGRGCAVCQTLGLLVFKPQITCDNNDAYHSYADLLTHSPSDCGHSINA